MFMIQLLNTTIYSVVSGMIGLHAYTINWNRQQIFQCICFGPLHSTIKSI